MSFLSPEIIGAILAVLGLVVSFLAGGSRARHKGRADRAEADKDAILKRKELEDEIENLPPADRRNRLDKWVREGK